MFACGAPPMEKNATLLQLDPQTASDVFGLNRVTITVRPSAVHSRIWAASLHVIELDSKMTENRTLKIEIQTKDDIYCSASCPYYIHYKFRCKLFGGISINYGIPLRAQNCIRHDPIWTEQND